MKKSVLLFILLLTPINGYSQSSPNWQFGYTPSPVEWNSWFSRKQDYPSPCTFSSCKNNIPLIPNATFQTDSNSNPSFIPNVVQPFVNLIAFGADSTCSTDSTFAFNSAVNSLGTSGGSVYIPPGCFKARDININTPIRLVGAGEGASIIDYTAATDHAFQFRPIGWPAVTRRNMPVGQGVQGITFTANSGTARALDFNGSTSCFIRDVKLTGSGSFNGIRLYGTYKCELGNVTTGYFISPTNTFLEIKGDLTGVCDPALPNCGASPFVCTLGNCSTRTDVTHLINVDISGNNGDGILLTDIVDDTTGENIQIENRSYALRTQCTIGYPNITYCPTEVNLLDFEAEGATVRPIQLIDSSGFHCVNCYTLGQGDIDIVMDTLNYTGESGFQWQGGRIFGATSACVFGRRWTNITISGALIYNCNTGAISEFGVALSSGVIQANINNNQFCTFAGSAPSTMGGVGLDTNADWVVATNNIFQGCSSNFSNSGSGTHIVSANNLGP